MPRLNALVPTAATGAARELLDLVKAKLGITPNLMRTLALAPAALKGYLDLDAALGGGVLDRKFREQIALAVAQANECGYCLAAHTTIGAMVGLSRAEIAASRSARASDSKRAAGLQFATAVVAARGLVSDSELAKARDAGISDSEVIEIVAHVALNIFTNYINHVAQTVVDFPPVDVELAATA